MERLSVSLSILPIPIRISLSELSSMLFRLNDEVKIVMEATEFLSSSSSTYLQEKGFFVSVINPYLMKSYRNESLRKAKTDKIGFPVSLYNYGIDHWFKMKEFLKLLERFMKRTEVAWTAISALYEASSFISRLIDPSFRFDHAWNKESSCKLE